MRYKTNIPTKNYVLPKRCGTNTNYLTNLFLESQEKTKKSLEREETTCRGKKKMLEEITVETCFLNQY